MKKYIIDEESLKSLLRESKMLKCLDEYHCIKYESVNFDDMLEEKSEYIENSDLSQFESIPDNEGSDLIFQSDIE